MKNDYWCDEEFEISIRSLERIFNLHKKIPNLISESEMKPQRGFFNLDLVVNLKLGLSFGFQYFQDLVNNATTHRKKCVKWHLDYCKKHFYFQKLLAAEQTWMKSLGILCLKLNDFSCIVGCFENVMFPLLDELLKPEIFKLDIQG